MRLLLLSALLFLYFLFTQFQCQRCKSEGFFKFKLSDWKISALDNSGRDPAPDNDGTSPLQAFGLRVSCTPKLDNPADTTDIVCRGFGSDTMYTAVRILTLMPFDSSHPAGSDVTDKWRWRVEMFNVYYSPASDLVMGFNERLSAYQDLLLLAPPPVAGKYQFELVVTKQDSTSIHLTTPVITLQ